MNALGQPVEEGISSSSSPSEMHRREALPPDTAEGIVLMPCSLIGGTDERVEGREVMDVVEGEEDGAGDDAREEDGGRPERERRRRVEDLRYVGLGRIGEDLWTPFISRELRARGEDGR